VIDKKITPNWLGPVLDLEKSLPMSVWLESFADKNEETIKEILQNLRKKYRKNFAYMSKTFLDNLFISLQIEKNKEYPKIFRKIVDDWDN